MGTHIRTTMVAAVALLSSLAISQRAEAGDPPIAMVMSVSGRTEPQVAPRAELQSGARVRLGSDSRIAFTMFGQCGAYTATGGTVVFERPEPKIEGGNLARGPGPCSRAHVLAKREDAAIAGGAVMRGGTVATTISPRPEFVVAGDGAWRVNGAWLIPASRPGTQIPLVLQDGRLRLPDEAPPLRSERYALRILVPVGESPALLQLSVSEETAGDTVDVVIVN